MNQFRRNRFEKFFKTAFILFKPNEACVISIIFIFNIWMNTVFAHNLNPSIYLIGLNTITILPEIAMEVVKQCSNHIYIQQSFLIKTDSCINKHFLVEIPKADIIFYRILYD